MERLYRGIYSIRVILKYLRQSLDRIEVPAVKVT